MMIALKIDYTLDDDRFENGKWYTKFIRRYPGLLVEEWLLQRCQEFYRGQLLQADQMQFPYVVNNAI